MSCSIWRLNVPFTILLLPFSVLSLTLTGSGDDTSIPSAHLQLHWSSDSSLELHLADSLPTTILLTPVSNLPSSPPTPCLYSGILEKEEESVVSVSGCRHDIQTLVSISSRRLPGGLVDLELRHGITYIIGQDEPFRNYLRREQLVKRKVEEVDVRDSPWNYTQTQEFTGALPQTVTFDISLGFDNSLLEKFNGSIEATSHWISRVVEMSRPRLHHSGRNVSINLQVVGELKHLNTIIQATATHLEELTRLRREEESPPRFLTVFSSNECVSDSCVVGVTYGGSGCSLNGDGLSVVEYWKDVSSEVRSARVLVHELGTSFGMTDNCQLEEGECESRVIYEEGGNIWDSYSNGEFETWYRKEGHKCLKEDTPPLLTPEYLTPTDMSVNEEDLQNCFTPSGSISTSNTRCLLDTPQFHSLFTPQLRSFFALFTKYGYELRFVGGVVRDLLKGLTPSDLDFGTNATMEQMGELFAREHIHATISPGGKSVGTLDPVFNNTIGYEVTSLQQESTESSHIKYTSPWEEDAHRRDFTVNTMSLGMDGIVYDYMGGRKDLKDGMVKFVGDIEQSIQEDHLRIFRYFRFYGRISGGPNDHCQYVLDSVRKNVAGIGGLPGPRIWVNWAGILNGNLAGEVMRTMLEVGMGPFMGLPERPDVEELDGVWLRTRDLGDRLNPVTLAVALLSDLSQVHRLADRLEWSDRERNLGVFIVTHRNLTHLDESDLLPAYRMIAVTSLTPDQDIKDFMTQLMFYLGDKDFTEEIPSWMTSRKTRSSFLKLYMDYMSTQSDIRNMSR